MAEKSLQERATRLKLAKSKEEEIKSEELVIGPSNANEQWKKLYARIREVTNQLRS